MTPRTVTTRVLMARAREHGRALTTLGDSVEWSGMAWPDVVGDPEWAYNAAARDACTAVAARLRGADELRPAGAAPRAVELRGVRDPHRGSRVTTARIGLGWLGVGRRRHTSGANR